MSDFHAVEDLVKAIDNFIVLLEQELQGGFSTVKALMLISKLANDPVYSTLIKDYQDFLPEFKSIDLPEEIKLLMIIVTGIPKYIEVYKNGKVK